MLSVPELIQHSWATLALGAAACIPGYALARFLPAPLRSRDSWAAWPVLGVAYWATALYILPWAGGLWLAAAVAGLAAIIRGVTTVRTAVRGSPKCLAVQTAREHPRSAHRVILAVGCAAFLTPLLTQHVPPGMDASRYVYSARLIAARAGLPATLAPFAPGVPFGAANHGLPATAGVAITCGATPAGAILASIALSFTALVLSLYLLVRLVTPRTPATVIAVGSVWLAREAQNTLTWGGFPCVLALAIAIVASRVLIDVLRHPAIRATIPLGLLVAGLPLVHACMAAGWLYIGAPLAAVLAFCISRTRWRGIRVVGLGAALALGIIVAYMLVARPGLDETAAQWVRVNELHGRFSGAGLRRMLSIGQYLATASGRVLTGLFIVAAVVLAVSRRPLALAAVLAVVALSSLVIANAEFEFLPGSLLLYPTRLRLFPIAAGALAFALAWRTVGRRANVDRRIGVTAAGILLIAALTYNVRYFQRTAVRPAISEPAWQALLWAGEHLEPRDTFVANMYGDAASYLPGVAGIAVSEFHANIADQTRAVERQARSRRVTHVFLTRPRPARSEPERAGPGQIVSEHYEPAHQSRRDRLQALVKRRCGKAVFTNESVEIYRLNL